MDVFCEQIVKQSMTAKRVLVVIAAVLVLLGACAASLIFLPMAFLPIAAFSGFGIYWVASMQSTEVEYEVTNGEIDIDQIIARRERKKIVRVRGAKLDFLLPVAQVPSDMKFDRIVMAARSKNQATWAFAYQGKKGYTLVLFEPSREVLEALCKGLSREVRIETDRARREM